MEKLGIDPAGHDAQLRGLEAVVDELLAIGLRGHEDRRALVVEPAHVLPGQIGQVVVLGQVPHVLHEVGVIDAGGPQAQQPGGGQAGQPHRAGRGDDQLVDAVSLDILEDFQKGREGEHLRFVFRHGEGPTGWKFFRSILVSGAFSMLVRTTSFRPVLRRLRQDLNGAAHAVDFREGVGDPGLVVAGAAEVRGRGEVGRDRLVKELVLVLGVEGRHVGRHAQGDRGQRGDRL